MIGVHASIPITPTYTQIPELIGPFEWRQTKLTNIQDPNSLFPYPNRPLSYFVGVISTTN